MVFVCSFSVDLKTSLYELLIWVDISQCDIPDKAKE